MTTMKVFDGSTWKVASLPAGTNATTYVGPEAPPGPFKIGDLWYDTDDVSTLVLPISVVNGGTGATTAAAARTTLAMPGEELAYGQLTATMNVTAVTTATAQIVVDSGTRTYDGSPIVIEFYAGSVSPPQAAAAYLILDLWDGSSALGRIGEIQTPAAGAIIWPVCLRRRITPSAGSHNYTVKASVWNSGTGRIVCGSGGTPDSYVPAHIRVTRA